MHSICICMITKVYEDEGWDKTRPVWFMSAADPVSAHLWAAHRSVTTAEKAPAVKPLPMWHRRARPEPRIQDSLASGELTWDDWQLFGSQMNPPRQAKSAIKVQSRHFSRTVINYQSHSSIRDQRSNQSRLQNHRSHLSRMKWVWLEPHHSSPGGTHHDQNSSPVFTFGAKEFSAEAETCGETELVQKQSSHQGKVILESGHQVYCCKTKAQNWLGKRIQGKAESTTVWTRMLSFRCEQSIINEATMWHPKVLATYGFSILIVSI